MDMTTLLPYASFGAMTFTVWAIISFMGGKQSRATERLDEMRDPARRGREQENKSSNMGRMLEKAAPALSQALQPKTELEVSALKLRLANAGFQSNSASSIYLAIKFVMLLVGSAAGAGYGLTMYGFKQNGLASIVIGGGIGFYLPEMVLVFLKRSRQEKIFLSLPDALDLLVVCVEAGLGLDAGMRRVSEELKDSAPELCAEFDKCNFQLQIGRPRRDVLHELGIRTGVDDLRALVAILIQADRFGSSVAQALRVQSDSMRIRRRQLAEERAQKTAVKMIFPLVLFIFPGIFVVLVGPAAINMYRQLLEKQ
ncbi:MAG: type II secretion system F family protein [Planctomycetota bacterium]